MPLDPTTLAELRGLLERVGPYLLTVCDSLHDGACGLDPDGSPVVDMSIEHREADEDGKQLWRDRTALIVGVYNAAPDLLAAAERLGEVEAERDAMREASDFREGALGDTVNEFIDKLKACEAERDEAQKQVRADDYRARGTLAWAGTFDVDGRSPQHSVDAVCARAEAAAEREARAVQMVTDLLLSADCSWEEYGGGHDWREACRRAREFLAQAGKSGGGGG